MKRAVRTFGVAVLATWLAASATGCGSVPTPSAKTSLARLRSQAGAGSDPELLGRWSLAEMIDPGGTGKEAKRARDLLAKTDPAKRGLLAHLAIGIDDQAHGRPKTSADGFMGAVRAAAESEDPLAPLVAWYATRQLASLRGAVTDLYDLYKKDVERLLERPGHLGWRAVAELEDWRSIAVYDRAETTGKEYDALVRKRVGCSTHVRIAGPFGLGVGPDRRRSFPAELPGPWPVSWPVDPIRRVAPRVLKVEQPRCLAVAQERTGDGIFYSETYFTTKEPKDLVIAVQGSLTTWVDDAPVLSRDLRDWGVWQRFGVAVHVGAGRHRILSRVLNDASSIRILNLDGTPAGVETDSDASKPYSLAAPSILPSVNAIDGAVTARRTGSALEGYLAAGIAHVEGLDDVASFLIEPYASPADAAAITLEAAALFTRSDPVYPDDIRRKNEKNFRVRANLVDDGLWYSRVWLMLDDAEKKGATESVDAIRALVAEFPAVPELAEQLARIYGRLEWRSERMTLLQDLAKRFPDDVGALRLYLDALEEDGSLLEADAVAERVKKLDPDAEVTLDRALARRDWKAAIAELERLGKRRPERKEIASRIADVLARSGDPSAAAKELDKALAKNPDDVTARFQLADRAFAKGDTTALRRALADSLQAGSKNDDLRDAIDLVEGATNLEPYRVDGKKVIREFEAWEKTGKKMDGSAARVLDYSAVWVRPDGSSEMLEHEIQRIQSQEAVGKESEQQPPTGLVLRIRVIKPDGTILEPEPVAGKPTLTLPHLEVGDYVEVEHVIPMRGDGQKGRRYRGPHWFFREADKGYWRSEFVTITPKDRPLDIETRGNVPKPVQKEKGTFVERRWRVEESPPALEEPDSPPPTEFLPSVRIGWGIDLADSLRELVDAASDETPKDPRLLARANEITKGIDPKDTDGRTKAIYRWVTENVVEGRDNDGRRVVMGKSGSKQSGFEHLLREIGVPLEPALVKNKLAMPPLGKMSEVENWDALVLRVTTNRGVRWLTVRDKFAPYGYVPAELRGQPAYRLVPGTPTDTVVSQGDADGIRFEGRADVRPDGSAEVELVQSFVGKLGISLRGILDRVAEGQRDDFVETRLLARNVPGARLRKLKVENEKDLDAPLVFRIRAEVPELLRMSGKDRAALKTVFPLRLAQLAALPTRQTPLLLATSSHVEVKFQVVLPEGTKMPANLPTGDSRDGERVVSVKDSVAGRSLELVRTVDIPAGRVQPGADYAKFVRFAQDADTLVEREILVGR
ncbi:MAG: tetratricopeptide repeat protein [Polyangiaceae bacterium]